ncbi:DISARM system SNF2-like helicase DrmD [Coriobacteriia bacterium Es71-Z0120]|uniref:DISARM system SNF2-like helicase DrmD n=1 Tax=Parvivirga hydrogeniphila TaxID=2939460 RepID=UPI002260C9A0|nr:DISARM system SNF2-like helicase DrmD [Parvivirga hydrogeniphila]MCL4079458.1 DISARM system SNF2-like helicase DrmD [Parvivirga hydrogeniphila]
MGNTVVPRPGMFAVVRNRRGVIAAVEPFDGEHGRTHAVTIEYRDELFPPSQTLIWELEGAHASVLEPNALPDPMRGEPMPPEDFDALVRAARWTSAMPYLDPDGSGPLGRLPFRSPFHAAVEVDDYQLVPLLKALRMPRVRLLIADDVGLGKTVEAGLILSELLIRRRIQRVLILTPASLRLQWRDEMREKFSLSFELVDREQTEQLRRRLGMDANPWRAFPRIIASYHYLRQPDILEQFNAACRTPDDSPRLPWDLLIVDECHNLMPSSFGKDSDLAEMLRIIAPRFEHRLFLSATPHNGHTRSFTGLLEILDPVRFSATDELRPAERARVEQLVIRRLKREINDRTDPPKFCRRLDPIALRLDFSPEEAALTEAFDKFRAAMRSWISQGDAKRRRAGHFAVEVLGKRLLSCPVAFADSWRRCKEGLAAQQAATEADVDVARKSVERDTDDDREAASRESVAATVVGAWLVKAAPHLENHIATIDRALARLGLDSDRADSFADLDPVRDARFDALVTLIEKLLRSDGRWRDDERLVVFTEYKTTLDYLARRLRERYEDKRVLTLFGGMDDADREAVKRAFNNPADAVRVLIATDAAAEGLNLQQTARYLLHFDLPWNPSKTEQRNGRLDRHGQARDVQIFHFASETDDDLRFLAHVMRKANDIREDLGSANELFDTVIHRKLIDGESMGAVEHDLDRGLTVVRGRASIEADDTVATGEEDASAAQQLEALAKELDLDPEATRCTLEAALAKRAGRPQLELSQEPGCWRLINPDLPGWREVVDESLRVDAGAGGRGAVRRLAFDPGPFVKAIGDGGRTVFNPRADVALMHLSHPMLERAFSMLSRARFPSSGEEVSRWTVRVGDVPAEADALVLLSVEELGVNELRETFHHWVRTIAFPVRSGRLSKPLDHRPAIALRNAKPTTDAELVERARQVFEDVAPDLTAFITQHARRLTDALTAVLSEEGQQQRQEELERYRSRSAEILTLINESTLAKLEREIEDLKRQQAQGVLFDEEGALDRLAADIEAKEAEIDRRRRTYEEVREQLERERERITKFLLPKRYAMAGDAHVFPVCVEIRLPDQGGAR